MPRHNIPKPKTIAERGGLEPYLDSTAKEHNGLAYKDFLFRINPKRRYRIPRTVIAEDFGVSPRTIYSWLHIHDAEQGTTAAKDLPAK